MISVPVKDFSLCESYRVISSSGKIYVGDLFSVIPQSYYHMLNSNARGGAVDTNGIHAQYGIFVESVDPGTYTSERTGHYHFYSGVVAAIPAELWQMQEPDETYAPDASKHVFDTHIINMYVTPHQNLVIQDEEHDVILEYINLEENQIDTISDWEPDYEDEQWGDEDLLTDDNDIFESEMMMDE